MNMIEERTQYQCENPACSLGAVGEPGHFTGGMTAAGINLLTGRPVESLEDHEHGEGVCPNCGQPGVLLDDPHLVVEGHDPLQPLHNQVATQVADPTDPLEAAGAQDALKKLASEQPTEPTPFAPAIEDIEGTDEDA